MAYQNIPRFEPNYGNRYGFRQRVSAPSTGPADLAVPGSPSAPPTPQEITSGGSRPANYHSGPSAESDSDGGIDHAADARTEAGLSLGNQVGISTPGQIASGLFSIAAPFGGFGLGEKIGTALDEATGFGDVPAHERYGAAGTIDPVSGGTFSTDGRAYDPLTGQALNSYNSRSSFYGGQYVQGIKENPFSLDSWLGDPANAPSFTAANQARAAGSNAALGFDAALANERGLFGGQDETGTGVTEEDRARLAQHIAVTDHGIAEHSAAAGSATNEAIQGRGYSASGAAPAGSQFSSTGTFSSGNDNNDSDHGQNETTQSGSQTSHSGGYGGFADDSATTSGGGSDSGGK